MKIKHKHRDRYIIIKIENNTEDRDLYRSLTHKVKIGVLFADGFFDIKRVYDSQKRLTIEFQNPPVYFQSCWLSGGLCYAKINCKGKEKAIKFAYNLVTEWFNYHEKIYQNTNEQKI